MPQTYSLACFAAPTSWNEDRTHTTLPRVTPAQVTLALSPGPNMLSEHDSKFEATTTTSYQMTYLPSADASFVFTEIINAKNFLGREGSFITQGKGTFTAATYVVKGTFEIVKETGTGALKGIEGQGRFGPAAEDPTKLKYEYEVEGIEAA